MSFRKAGRWDPRCHIVALAQQRCPPPLATSQRIFPRDPNFADKAGPILDLYERIWEGAHLADDYVISADETSGIQARRRKQPTLPPAPSRSTRVEHEYVRAKNGPLRSSFLLQPTPVGATKLKSISPSFRERSSHPTTSPLWNRASACLPVPLRAVGIALQVDFHRRDLHTPLAKIEDQQLVPPLEPNT
jgi:hypothetical protein